MRSTANYRCVCLLLGFSAVLVLGCGSPAEVPQSYVHYNSKKGVFACDAPEKWTIDDGGKQGPVWAKFTSGDAMIKFKQDTVASVMADSLGGGMVEDPAVPPQMAPVHDLHIKNQEAAAEDFNNYTELPGGPLVLKCPLGPARVSEFTATTSLGSAQHGYRATAVGHDAGMVVYCTCSEDQWKSLQGAFDHVLGSVTRGESE